MNDVITMVKTAAKALDEKKAQNIKIIKIDDVTSLAEYFIICTGTSNTQIKSLADFAEVSLKEIGEEPLHNEGYISGSWVLLDYGALIIHVFNNQTRDFYALEKLWQNGTEIDIDTL